MFHTFCSPVLLGPTAYWFSRNKVLIKTFFLKNNNQLFRCLSPPLPQIHFHLQNKSKYSIFDTIKLKLENHIHSPDNQSYYKALSVFSFLLPSWVPCPNDSCLASFSYSFLKSRNQQNSNLVQKIRKKNQKYFSSPTKLEAIK